MRPTADGLRVLGEWPPAEGAAVNVALARILRGLADSDQVQEPDKMATRRAAGTLANTTEGEASNLKRAAAAVRRAAPGVVRGMAVAGLSAVLGI